MPPQGRIGDQAFCPADAHGCPACPHPTTGPAVLGSANVLVNGRPALRVGDPGIHAACCGPNKWNAKTGSGSVLINGLRAHRLSDMTKHCGGFGRLVEGSPNVITGDLGGGGAATAPSTENEQQIDLEIQVVSKQTARQLGRVKVKIKGPVTAGQLTDADGKVKFQNLPAGQYDVRVRGRGYRARQKNFQVG